MNYLQEPIIKTSPIHFESYPLGTRKIQTDHTNTWAVANALGISYVDVTDVTNIQEKTAEEFDADDSLITTKENKIAKKS